MYLIYFRQTLSIGDALYMGGNAYLLDKTAYLALKSFLKKKRVTRSSIGKFISIINPDHPLYDKMMAVAKKNEGIVKGAPDPDKFLGDKKIEELKAEAAKKTPPENVEVDPGESKMDEEKKEQPSE